MRTRGYGLFIAVILLGMLAMAGCTGSSSTAQVTIDETSAGKTVSLKVGDTLEVRLEGNPSTGYEWSVAAPSGSALTQVGERTFVSKSTLLGAPGVYIFRFKAESKGTEELVFTYKRAWETTPEDRTVTVKVSIK